MSQPAHPVDTADAAHAAVAPAAPADVWPVAPELTIYQVAELRPQWLAAVAGGARRFDLSAVTEIDGAGLQLLAALRRLGQRDGLPLLLVEASAVVQDALGLLGAGHLLDADRCDALGGRDHA